MLAFHQFLTASTTTVVIFGYGVAAIAQESPLAFPSEDLPEQQLLLSNQGTVLPFVEHQSISATEPTPSLSYPNQTDAFQAQSADSLSSTTPLLTNVGALTGEQPKAELSGKSAVEDNPTTEQSLRFPVKSSESIASTEYLPTPLPLQGTLTTAEPKPKQFIIAQGSLPGSSSLEEGIAPSETLTIPNEADEQNVIDATEEASDPDMDDSPADEMSMPEASSEETPPDPADDADTEASEEPGDPAIAEPPEGNITAINEELEKLLEKVDNPAVSVPQDGDEVLAENITDFTLEEVIPLALDRNETLEEARLNYQRAEYQLREAYAEEYPNINIQSDLTRNQTPGAELQAEAFDFDEEGPTTAFATSFEISYPVYTGGRRSAQIESAIKQLDINALEIERIAEETRLAATRAYYDLQSADSQVNIEESAVENATQSLRDADLLEQAGLGTKFDVLRAQVDLANAEQRLTRAFANQRTARRQLAQILSLEADVDPRSADVIEVTGDWDLSLEDTIVAALQNREELRQVLLQRDIDESQKVIAASTTKPQVNIFANYQLLDRFDDGLAIADGFAIGARMQWNLYDGGATKARVDQEDVDMAIAENRFINQRNLIRLAVESAYYNLEANEENIATAAVAVELAQESLRLARIRFRAGVGTQTEVIDAQTELTTAQGNLLQAITDYNRAFAQLKREVSSDDILIAIPNDGEQESLNDGEQAP